VTSLSVFIVGTAYRYQLLDFEMVLFMSRTDQLVNPLNAELNSICHLLAILGAHHSLHIGRIRVKQKVSAHCPCSTKPTCFNTLLH